MKIAKQLRDSNIEEYLLYMWQIEDTLRAYGCDADRLAEDYVPRLGLRPEESRREAQWLADLCTMMREEGTTERGHLQMNRGTLAMLTDLHLQLLDSPKHPFYSAAYYKALPFIVELRNRGDKDVSEIETCLNALYGTMMLRLQGKKISPDTEHAVKEISTFLGMLSDYHIKDKTEGLRFDDDEEF